MADETRQCDIAGVDISAHLDGELSGIDAARVEAHLKKCRDCTREMDLFRECSKRIAGIVERRPSAELETVLTRRSRDYLDGFQAQQRRSRMALAARSWALRGIVAALVIAVAGWGVYLAGRLWSARFEELVKSGEVVAPARTTPAEKTTLPAGKPTREDKAGTSATEDARRPGKRSGTRPQQVKDPGHTGWWRLSFGSPPADMGFVKLAQDGKTVVMPGDTFVKGRGSLDERNMLISRTDARAQEEFSLEAEFDVNGQSFAGTTAMSYGGGSSRSSVRIFGEKAAPEMVAVLASQAKAAGTVAEREKRLKKVYQVLQRYAREHIGTFPYELTELVPAYLDDSGLAAGAEGVREVTYQGGLEMPPSPEDRLPPEVRVDVTPEEAPDLYAEGAEERVAPFFTELMSESWKIAPCGRAILYLDGTTAWVADPATVPPVPSELADRRANQRMLACQANMRKLESALVRWLRDWEGAYPLNLESLYPEWLTDLSVLTCPEEEPHTICYELVYTGEARPLEEDFASPEAAAEYYATMPVVVEIDAPHFAGRNVLYMDGQTEWHHASERY